VNAAATIAAALGDARREGRAWRCRCPLHSGRSLVLRDGDVGNILVTCWGGCNPLDVLTELRRCGLLDRQASYQQSVITPPRADDWASRIACARRIWDGACDALRSPVARYLAGRGITIPLPQSLRWVRRCPHPRGGCLPAMIGLVEHCNRGVVGIHRTYLTADGVSKAIIEPTKAGLGPVSGGSVRLGTPRVGGWLLVAEGVETALSVAEACAMPAWAALSAPGIRALVLPPEATHIVICADHDASGTGQRAAREAADRWLAEGRRVRIAMPPESDTDFADMLTAVTAEDPGEARRVP
jgi:putative DNA primase/helicase